MQKNLGSISLADWSAVNWPAYNALLYTCCIYIDTRAHTASHRGENIDKASRLECVDSGHWTIFSEKVLLTRNALMLWRKKPSISHFCQIKKISVHWNCHGHNAFLFIWQHSPPLTWPSPSSPSPLLICPGPSSSQTHRVEVNLDLSAQLYTIRVSHLLAKSSFIDRCRISYLSRVLLLMVVRFVPNNLKSKYSKDFF